MDVASLYIEPELAPAVVPAALELLDVFRIFRAGDIEAVALRGLTLRVEVGEVVGVLGPSGSGKSTFLALAAGIDEPSAGDVRANGRSLTRLSERDLASYRAHDVGLVFQRDNLWPTLSALDNVRASLQLSGRTGDHDAMARAALERFGLGGRARSRVTHLSGGEQQRVAMAAAAARRAPLVLADEPTGELDSENERAVLDHLLALRDAHSCTVVIVTHSAQVASAADRVIEIRDGRVA